MSTQNKATAEHAAELLSSLGPITQKRMFGGFGLYAEGVMIALIAFERVFLKTDETSRPLFLAAGCESFSYDTAKGKVVVTSYYEPPADAFDSVESMRPWAQRAIEAALRFANAKPKTKAKPNPKAEPKATTRAAKLSKPATKTKPVAKKLPKK